MQQDTQVTTKKARESSVQVVSRHLTSLVVLSRQMRFFGDDWFSSTADDLTQNGRQQLTTT
jgi:hypothetical protein